MPCLLCRSMVQGTMPSAPPQIPHSSGTWTPFRGRGNSMCAILSEYKRSEHSFLNLCFCFFFFFFHIFTKVTRSGGFFSDFSQLFFANSHPPASYQPGREKANMCFLSMKMANSIFLNCRSCLFRGWCITLGGKCDPPLPHALALRCP